MSSPPSRRVALGFVCALLVCAMLFDARDSGFAGAHMASLLASAPSGEYNAALLFRHIAFAGPGLLDPSMDATRTSRLLSHAQVSRECPKFVVNKQNPIAGAGHRLMQAIMALWFARSFGVTYVHSSLEEGTSRHESYAGWDAFLGSRIGENNFTAEKVLSENVRIDLFAPVTGGFAAPNDVLVREWGPRALDPALCGVVYTLPLDFWAYDIGHNTRAVLAWKHAEALRLGLAPLPPPRSRVFSPGAVAVAVHFRFENVDGLPQRVGSVTLARIVGDTVLPALRSVGIPGSAIDIHVFTNQANVSAGAAVLGALAELPRVRVHGFESMNALATMWHLLDADITVGCRSSFSTVGGLVALKPLFLQNSFVYFDDQRMRHCNEGSGCCDETGRCTDATHYALNTAALRIASSYRHRGRL